jgi:hypothetical protein
MPATLERFPSLTGPCFDFCHSADHKHRRMRRKVFSPRLDLRLEAKEGRVSYGYAKSGRARCGGRAAEDAIATEIDSRGKSAA